MLKTPRDRSLPRYSMLAVPSFAEPAYCAAIPWTVAIELFSLSERLHGLESSAGFGVCSVAIRSGGGRSRITTMHP